MNKVIVFNKEYVAERIVKTTNSIIGYNGEREVFAFRGISDFSLFQIEGEFQKDEYEKLKEDVLSISIALAAVIGGAE